MEIAERISTMCGANVPYLRKLKCLIGTGAQFINTGIAVKNISHGRIKLDFQFTRYSGYGTVVGIDTDYSLNFFGPANSEDTFYFRFSGNRYDSKIYYSASRSILNMRFLVEANSGDLSVESTDGSFKLVEHPCYSEEFCQSQYDDYTLKIFNYITNRSAGKLYSVLFGNQNGEIIFNGIPVLDKDGTPCLYDSVSNTMFYNAGTGSFGYEELNGEGV